MQYNFFPKKGLRKTLTTPIRPDGKVVIFGAGLVGTLLGILLADRGFRVEIHEKRPDMRYRQFTNLRSINLALSHRGWQALDMAGLSDDLKNVALPMFGRVVHPLDGETGFQPYGKKGQAIYSVSRHHLNCFLLDEAEKRSNLKIYFESKAEKFAFDKSLAYVADIEGLRHRLEADAFFGSDGAFSALRYEMMREDKFFYHQQYIEHGYKEFTIVPAANGDWAMRPDGLHIWPRKSFMMIALPNLDKTFTCTLFFPFQGGGFSFESIKNQEGIKRLFEEEFPDLIPLIPDYALQFSQHPVASLVTIRCAPWNNRNFCLIGDAAHAIVPFYGQGMIAGFEDCRVLINMLPDFDTWEDLLEAFYKRRKPDGDAISELALDNFVEMRDLVTDPVFLLKKKLESRILAIKKYAWIPIYTMISFSDLPYSEARAKGKIQSELLDKIMKSPDFEEGNPETWDTAIGSVLA